MTTLAGFVPWAVSGMMMRLGSRPCGQVGGADDEQAGELAVGAGRRLQRGGVQAGDLGEPALELVHQLERALHQRLRLVRVQPREAVEAGGDLVDSRVVLHGARAERVAAAVHAVVERREPGEVAQQVDLADLGQARRARCGAGASGTSSASGDLGHAERGQAVRAPAGAATSRRWSCGRVGRTADGRRAVTASPRSATVHLPAREDAAEASAKASSSARVRFSVTATSSTSSRPASPSNLPAKRLAGTPARKPSRHQRVDQLGRRHAAAAPRTRGTRGPR